MAMLPLSTPLLNKLFPYSILQAITSPKPSSPPTLKSWLLYRWNRFKQRTDKWELLQWYLVILAIIACVLFSSLYQSRVMDLDRTNRIFYKREFEIIFKKVKSRKTSNLQRVTIKWSPVKIM